MKQENQSIFNSTKNLFYFFNSLDQKRFYLMSFFALIISFSEIITAAVAMIFAQVLNDPSVGKTYLEKINLLNNFSDNNVIFVFALFFGIVFVTKNLIMLIDSYIKSFFIQKMAYEFKERMMFKITDNEYESFIEKNIAYNINIMTGDIDRVYSIGVTSISGAFLEICVFIFLSVFIFFSNPILAFFILLLMTIVFLPLLKVLLPRFYKWGEQYRDYGVLEHQNLIQFFQGFKEILFSNTKPFFIKTYGIHAKAKALIQGLINFAGLLPRIFIETLFIFIFVFAVYVLTKEYQNNSTEIISILSLYLYAGFRLAPSLNRIITHLSSLKSVIPSVNRVRKEFLKHINKNIIENKENFSFKEKIKLENVSFKYKNKRRFILKKINLEINKGDLIGIVGKTGSGKSTLINLIIGLLKPTIGEVSIDSNFSAFNLKWREKIGLVPQKSFLIDSTIEKNISFGRKLNSKKINKALRSANLQELIKVSDKGLQTSVGDGGINLSGGEQQRIIIARALYSEPELLVFDEATSALDYITEKNILKTIKKLKNKTTIIIISHKESSLKNCNKIFKIANGNLKSYKLNIK